MVAIRKFGTTSSSAMTRSVMWKTRTAKPRIRFFPKCKPSRKRCLGGSHGNAMLGFYSLRAGVSHIPKSFHWVLQVDGDFAWERWKLNLKMQTKTILLLMHFKSTAHFGFSWASTLQHVVQDSCWRRYGLYDLQDAVLSPAATQKVGSQGVRDFLYHYSHS